MGGHHDVPCMYVHFSKFFHEDTPKVKSEEQNLEPPMNVHLAK
jgi:hypothetical protein